jgi:hypothetical protein
MSFLQREPQNCANQFWIKLSDLIQIVRDYDMDEAVMHRLLNPISKEIHQRYERDLLESHVPTVSAMMKKWKECDSDDCRSRLLVLDDGSSNVQKALDRQTDFVAFVNRTLDHPLERASALASRIRVGRDRKNLGFDLKDGLKCLMRILAEHKVANRLAKMFPGPVEIFTTNFEDTNRCLNSNDYISLENWSEVKDATKIIIFPEGKRDKGYCYLIKDLLESLSNTVVFHWIGEGKGADYDVPYFKLPVPPFWIDLAGFMALFTFPNPKKPLENLPGMFQLKKLGTDSVGTSFGISTLHGAKEDIYTIHQVEEKEEKKSCVDEAERLLGWVWNVDNDARSVSLNIRDEKTGQITRGVSHKMTIRFGQDDALWPGISLGGPTFVRKQDGKTLNWKEAVDLLCLVARKGEPISLHYENSAFRGDENARYEVGLKGGSSYHGFRFIPESKQGGLFRHFAHLSTPVSLL